MSETPPTEPAQESPPAAETPAPEPQEATQEQLPLSDEEYLSPGGKNELLRRFNERFEKEQAEIAAKEDAQEADAPPPEPEKKPETPVLAAPEAQEPEVAPEKTQADYQALLGQAQATTDEAERLKGSYTDLQTRLQGLIDEGKAHEAMELMGFDLADVVRKQVIDTPSEEEQARRNMKAELMAEIKAELVDPLQKTISEDKTLREQAEQQRQRDEYLRGVAEYYGAHKDELPHLDEYTANEIVGEVYRRAADHFKQTGQSLDMPTIFGKIHTEQQKRHEYVLKRYGADPAKTSGTASEAQPPPSGEQAPPTGPTLTNAGSSTRGNDKPDFLNRRREEKRVDRAFRTHWQRPSS